MKWKQQPKFVKTRKCNLEARILLNLPENSNALKIYEATTDFSELVKYMCEMNLYVAQNGNSCFFKHKLYYVYFKATKLEILLEC